jgi:hypothetical protein
VVGHAGARLDVPDPDFPDPDFPDPDVPDPDVPDRYEGAD